MFTFPFRRSHSKNPFEQLKPTFGIVPYLCDIITRCVVARRASPFAVWLLSNRTYKSFGAAWRTNQLPTQRSFAWTRSIEINWQHLWKRWRVSLTLEMFVELSNLESYYFFLFFSHAKYSFFDTVGPWCMSAAITSSAIHLPATRGNHRPTSNVML